MSTSNVAVNEAGNDLFRKEVNTLCLDYLLMETIPLSLRVTKTLSDSSKGVPTQGIRQLKIDPKKPEEEDLLFRSGGIDILLDDTAIQDENSIFRIESYGYEIGTKLADCLIYMKSDGNLQISQPLDIMKFICRDVWKLLYSKQMDNLRTNHSGTFVLIDHNFRLISNMASPLGDPDTLKRASLYLWFPCGIIRGILFSLGLEASVHAEITQFPSVSFNIQTNQS
ncbi:unnamed protein product [Kuraishia capsulata CBS 1993]|uniref:Trafficking protein particle complex subunit 6B n=1 Tax=Kuraishia capsulata CBS 1993 TaxID=1382522 RepID=W6MK77_9ASCO|nr:uncharacterized protein KUCA_T00002921001 [Kuraishia capsulata CBS 1993]CDK26944.1 unnamed protein product [Kuraishia capsulata CBS 1993]